MPPSPFLLVALKAWKAINGNYSSLAPADSCSFTNCATRAFKLRRESREQRKQMDSRLWGKSVSHQYVAVPARRRRLGDWEGAEAWGGKIEAGARWCWWARTAAADGKRIGKRIGRPRFSRLPVCFYTNFVGFRLIFFVGFFWPTSCMHEWRIPDGGRGSGPVVIPF
jgi:hypothetical protein